MTQNYILKIYRGFFLHQYWEEFELPQKEKETIISALRQIQKNPVNREGKKTTPVAWEQNCQEEVCGSCAILINGVPQLACSALIDTLLEDKKKRIITLAPLSKFLVIKDLVVDRSTMFEDLKRIKGWIDVPEENIKILPSQQEKLYVLSTCINCGCCIEACPQVNNHSKFIGPAIVSQIAMFNSHPFEKKRKSYRLRQLLSNDGIASCKNAQNCIEVCPKNIPLTESIAKMGKETLWQAIKDLF